MNLCVRTSLTRLSRTFSAVVRRVCLFWWSNTNSARFYILDVKYWFMYLCRRMCSHCETIFWNAEVLLAVSRRAAKEGEEQNYGDGHVALFANPIVQSGSHLGKPKRGLRSPYDEPRPIRCSQSLANFATKQTYTVLCWNFAIEEVHEVVNLIYIAMSFQTFFFWQNRLP